MMSWSYMLSLRKASFFTALGILMIAIAVLVVIKSFLGEWTAIPAVLLGLIGLLFFYLAGVNFRIAGA